MFRRLAHPLALTTTLALASGCDAPRRAAHAEAAACTPCHGDPAAGNAAPPRSVRGATDTAQLAVGAHQAHLTAGALHQPIACGECHVVPDAVDAPGHMGKEYAAVVFGPLAGGAAASWDRAAATCATYCHGATLSGGSHTAPQWTRVDGTQATCGACHGVPPPAPHVQSTGCGDCHDGYTATTVNLATHVDGKIDTNGASCTSCHGSAASAAPPKGTHGETATTDPAVGAHQSHLTAGALRVAVPCAECHVVPASVASHPSGTLDLTFGTLARTGGAQPRFDGTSCASTYCHGATLNAGGTLQAPAWTKVDGSQAACGTCHGVPPPAPHVQSTDCGSCHPGYTSTSVDLATHIDGQLQAAGGTCTSCHGQAGQTASASSPLAAAPPTDTQGAATGLRVGAHQKHLAGGAYSSGMACQTCHAAVGSYTTAHRNGVADVGFSGAAPASLQKGTFTPRSGTTAATCAGTACHAVQSSSGQSAGGTVPAPAWSGAITSCGACHGTPPATGQHSRSNHVSAGCGACHASYASTSVNKALHVNGTADVGGSGTRIDSYSPASRSCAPQCHGNETW